MPGLGFKPRNVAVNPILVEIDYSCESIAVRNGVVGRRRRLSKEGLVQAVDRVARKDAGRNVLHPLDAVGKAHASGLGRHKAVEEKKAVIVALGIVPNNHNKARIPQMFVNEPSEPGPAVLRKRLGFFDRVFWNLVGDALLRCFSGRWLHVALEFIHRDPTPGGINNGNGAWKEQLDSAWPKRKKSATRTLTEFHNRYLVGGPEPGSLEIIHNHAHLHVVLGWHESVQ